MERTVLHTWNLAPAVVLSGLVSIIIHRNTSFFLILLSGFWLEHSARWAFWVDGRREVSPVFRLHWVPIIRSLKTRLHPPITACHQFPCNAAQLLAPMLQSAIWTDWVCLAWWVASWSKWQSHMRKACIFTEGEEHRILVSRLRYHFCYLVLLTCWLFILPCCLTFCVYTLLITHRQILFILLNTHSIQ